MFEFLTKLFSSKTEDVEQGNEPAKELAKEQSIEELSELQAKPQQSEDTTNVRLKEHTCIDKCSVCGFNGEFHKDNRSFREGYQCPECKSSLRYRGQATSIFKIYGKAKYDTITDLSEDEAFSQLTIYEPGVIGPFRKLFSAYKGYKNSFYWDDVELGEYRDDIQCQSLEDLTFGDNEIDLIISSDILEHVRHPWVAFEDIYRVLKPGGYHVFSIPVHLPMKNKTSYRVDTSGDKDIHIEEPHYHGDGVGGKSLVYTDFGADIEQHLIKMGYKVILETLDHQHEEVRRLLTFVTQK